MALELYRRKQQELQEAKDASQQDIVQVMNLVISGGVSSLASTTAYKQHTLTSLDGSIFGSVNSNQLTIPAGTYVLHIPISANGDCDGIDFGLYDANLTSYIFEKRVFNNPGAGEDSGNTMSHVFTLASEKTLEFHTKAQNPAGAAEAIFQGIIIKLS